MKAMADFESSSSDDSWGVYEESEKEDMDKEGWVKNEEGEEVEEMWGVERQRERLDIDKESFKVSLVRMKGKNCDAHATRTKIKKKNQDRIKDQIKDHVKDHVKDMA